MFGRGLTHHISLIEIMKETKKIASILTALHAIIGLSTTISVKNVAMTIAMTTIAIETQQIQS